MTRAHIADPHLVNKLREGRSDEIRQCVGANYCIDRNYRGDDVLCIQNAATGRERSIPHIVPRAARSLRVVVVGGGPAGMEAARVCAQRGHSVTLFEKAPALGGQITLAARAPARDQMAGITRWLSMELQRLRIDLRLGRAADLQSVRALAPQVVVVATGGEPDLAGQPLWRAHEGNVVSSHALLAGAVQPAASVLVYDRHGGYAGATCADFLAQRGCLVEIVTPDLMVAEDLGGTTRPVYLKRFYEKDVVLTVNLSLHEVYREGLPGVGVGAGWGGGGGGGRGGARRGGAGRPADVDLMRGVAALPKRYLVDVHAVVLRDPQGPREPRAGGGASARMHVLTAGGLVLAPPLALLQGPTPPRRPWLAGGLLAAPAVVAAGGALGGGRRRPARPGGV